jgi:hypothetical protein
MDANPFDPLNSYSVTEDAICQRSGRMTGELEVLPKRGFCPNRWLCGTEPIGAIQAFGGKNLREVSASPTTGGGE